jgi:hypothetical protein
MFFYLAVAFSCIFLNAQAQHVAPYFGIRSQANNGAQMVLNTQAKLFPQDQETHAQLNITAEYQHSFQYKKIANILFGQALQTTGSGAPFIRISGSQASSRNAFDLLADNFYLPVNFISTMSIRPSIETYLAHLRCNLILNEWVDGLSVEFYLPIVHTKWRIKTNETVLSTNLANSVPGYLVSDNSLTTGLLQQDASDYFAGVALTKTAASNSFNSTIFNPLQYAKISPDGAKRTGAGDLHTRISYNFCQNEVAAAGFSVEIVAPCGNKPKGEFLFEPMAGNGHHWQLGAGLHGSYLAWESNENNRSIYLDIDMEFSHYFETNQIRVFDLKGRPLSRYMLTETLGAASPTAGIKVGQQTVAYQFQQEFTPLANLTALPAYVSKAIDFDLTGLFRAQFDALNLNLGFEVWIASSEKIRLRNDNPFIANTTWALKGDAQVYGFNGTTPIPLSATENASTAYSGANFPAGGNPTTAQIIAGRENSSVDSAGPATSGGTLLTYDPSVASSTANQINSSLTPLFITERDLDVDGARVKNGSCKLFGQIDYCWENCSDRWTPQLGIGSEVEWGHNGHITTDHIQVPFSQWGVWIQGTISY